MSGIYLLWDLTYIRKSLCSLPNGTGEEIPKWTVPNKRLVQWKWQREKRGSGQAWLWIDYVILGE